MLRSLSCDARALSSRKGRGIVASAISAAIALALGCSAPAAPGDEDVEDGVVEGSGPGTGDGSGGSATPAAGGQTSGGFGDPTMPVATGGQTGEEEYCQETKVDFVPKIPTAYILVDMSGSMGMNDENFWEPLKGALLPAVEALQADVRLGFGTYTSSEASQCASPTSVVDDLGTIGFDNYSAINTMYGAYGDPASGDTPTSFAIDEAVELLLADTEAPGDKFIILVTDGNPDFCDNVPAKCAQDATVAALQAAYSQGIKTLVFGLEAQTQQPLEANIMALFANAGDGQPVSWSEAADKAEDPGNSQLTYECRSDPYPALLGTGTSIGTYGDSNGTAEAFLGGDPVDLVESLRSQVEGLKSCIFDLTEAGLEIEAGKEDTGNIFVADMAVPIAMSDWRMNSASELELLGASCELWKSPNVTEFFAGFPCDAVIKVVFK